MQNYAFLYLVLIFILFYCLILKMFIRKKPVKMIKGRKIEGRSLKTRKRMLSTPKVKRFFSLLHFLCLSNQGDMDANVIYCRCAIEKNINSIKPDFPFNAFLLQFSLQFICFRSLEKSNLNSSKHYLYGKQ